MRHYDPIYVSKDDETSVVLCAIFDYGKSEKSESLERVVGYTVLLQKVIRDSVQSCSLYFLPNVSGYAEACAYTISLRQQTWGDSAP